MRKFSDAEGRTWIADAAEQTTPRHHGRWYLVFRPEGSDHPVLPMHEVRWQSRASAERTIRTMSEIELRRRLRLVSARAEADVVASRERGGAAQAA